MSNVEWAFLDAVGVDCASVVGCLGVHSQESCLKFRVGTGEELDRRRL
jgi:hypothetical protein